MIRVFIFICCLFATIQLRAQQFRFGTEAGPASVYAPMRFAGSQAFAHKVMMYPGFAAGATVSFSPKASSKWEFNSGAGVNIWFIGQEFTGQSSTIIIKNHFTTLDVPLLAKYNLNRSFAVAIGADLQVPVYGRQRSMVTINAGGEYITTNNTRTLTRNIWPALQAACFFRINTQWEMKLYYKYLPGGFYKQPNNNNQYFNQAHTAGLSIGYRK